MTRPSASGWPRRSSSGEEARRRRARRRRCPSATGGRSCPRSRPATSVPNRSRMAARIRAAEASGIARQERDGVAASPGPTFEASTPRVRAHEAVARLDDQHAALHAHDPRRLAQDDLDLARRRGPTARAQSIACGDGRRPSAGRRRRPPPWTRPSGSRRGRRRAATGSAPGVASSASPIIRSRSSPSRDLGQAGERDDLDPAGPQSTCERLRGDRLGEQQVLGRVDVEVRARRGPRANGDVGGRGEPGVAGARVAAERRVDRRPAGRAAGRSSRGRGGPGRGRRDGRPARRRPRARARARPRRPPGGPRAG